MSGAVNPLPAAAEEPAEAAPAPAAPADQGARPPAASDHGASFDGPYERCIEPLLTAAGWRGDRRQIAEAMPHLEALSNVNDLRLVLHRIGYRSTFNSIVLDQVLNDHLPALAVHGGGPVAILSRLPNGLLRVFDGARGEERLIEASGERVRLLQVYSLLDGEADAAEAEGRRDWLRGAFLHLGRDVAFACFLTFIANLLALGAPLFTMSVYNTILPSEGLATLAAVAALAVAALGVESYFRRERAKALSTATARLNFSILAQSFGRILALPAGMTENASVTDQVNRVKQFEGIVGGFSGPVVGALFDLPFVFIFLVTIGWIGGPLVFAPLVAIGLFVLLATLLAPVSNRATLNAASAKERAQSLTFEMINALETIHEIGAASVWRRRVGEAHRRAVGARLRASFLEYLRVNGSLFIIAICMVVTISFGALMIAGGALSIGGLVAISMLAARVLGPAQTLFLSLQQIAASREAARRFDALLRLKAARTNERPPAVFRPFAGAIRMRDVAFRFANSDEFALRGVSAEIKAGETIGLVGPGGSGKSTLLKMLLGLYRPISGQIMIDGANMAQIHHAELRSAIAFAAADPEFFYGTLRQNMTLGRSSATREQVIGVLEELEIDITAAPFSNGLETRMSAAQFRGLSIGLRQRLSLARALLKDAPITLLDEPAAMLDASGGAALLRAIERRRGTKTLIMTLNERRFLEACDRIMVLVGGKTARFDTPAAILQPAPDKASAAKAGQGAAAAAGAAR